jgi:hypothetical protein
MAIVLDGLDLRAEFEFNPTLNEIMLTNTRRIPINLSSCSLFRKKLNTK